MLIARKEVGTGSELETMTGGECPALLGIDVIYMLLFCLLLVYANFYFKIGKMFLKTGSRKLKRYSHVWSTPESS